MFQKCCVETSELSLPVFSPGGGLGIFADRGSAEYIFGYCISKNLYFLGAGHSCCTFLGLLNKCSIIKCVRFSTVFLGV